MLHNTKRLEVIFIFACFVQVVFFLIPVAPAEDGFASVVKPVLKKHCFDCHMEGHAEGGVALDQYHSFADAVRSPKTWLKVWDSMESGVMPPSSESRVGLEDIQRVTDWVQNDLLPTLGTNPSLRTSHVIRRLNRHEYNSTVKDLFGVGGDYAKDFPTDEMSFGYDNIGAALSISPIHIEKYLRAAEHVALDAIHAPDVSEHPPRELIGLTTYPLAEKGSVSFEHRLPPGQYLIDFSLVRVGVAETVPAPTIFVSFGTDCRNIDAVQIQDETIVYRFWLNVLEKDKSVTVRIADQQTTPVTIDNKNEVTSTTSGDQRYGANKGLHVDSMVVRGPHASDFSVLGQEARIAYGRECVKRLVEKAYRHPVTAEDAAGCISLYERAILRGESCERAMQVATMAILVSPKFLYHVPARASMDASVPARASMDASVPGRASMDASKPTESDPFVLANRLSYFLWSSLPDEELRLAAASNTLRSDISNQVRRMLVDPKSERFVSSFVGQWLQLRKLQDASPDRELFPGVDDSVLQSMQNETVFYVDDIFRNNHSVLNLLDSNYSYINATLARYYGLKESTANDVNRFVRVDLPSVRGGLMTHASILTLTSNPKRTSPVKRGQWILERLLGTPPPPPPPNVPDLDEQKEANDALTLRERLEQHRSQPDCAACHVQMDAIGFALENFDAVGVWRERDGLNKVDSSGSLAGGRNFSDARELRQLLVKTESKRFTRCLIENLLTYALGRGLEPTDYGTVESIRKELTKHDYSSHVLIESIVASPQFQTE